jgi:hypothetical protein
MAAALIFTGCFFNKRLTVPGFGSGGKNLKKRIAIIFADNSSKSDIKKILYKVKENFLQEISEDSDNIILLDDKKGKIEAEFLNLPVLYSNNYDNLFLVPAGRRLGLYAVVFVSADVVSKRRATGFFMFKKYLNFSVIKVKAVVYDMGTGAKLLDKVFSDEVKREYDDFVNVSDAENQIDFSEYEDIIIDIAEDAAEEVCEVIEAGEWESYIITRDENKAIIFAGDKTGLIEGDILNVYDANSTVKSLDMQHFLYQV